MAAADDTKSLRRARFAPYGLLSPGLIWLALFFLVPLTTLIRLSLSEKPNAFLPEYNFTGSTANFTNAIGDNTDVLGRSFLYAAAATVAAILIGYPLAYFVAFRAGKYRTILLGLVILPFYTSFLIRTLAWKSLLADEGPVLRFFASLKVDSVLEAVGVMQNGRVLNTSLAVIGGLTYNFLAFMILPIYVSLEKIDVRLLDAAQDLYSSPRAAFRRVVLPLSLPGVFAGTLLVFIPAAGDFVNAELLGGPNNAMIGSKVKDLLLNQSDYPSAAALSLVFMVLITTGVLLYARVLGTDELVG